ncbi:uncharacterized protein BDCG_08592 [Blastomyces dermatitidis ER-3]|uniref:Uncharacterized protein n=1 Tax=Ajellomyces dermatitidis (strain ER-3 / ATCC MYA-2586) TaxID=559297 RepID=A0ABP2EP94_AJEDR|nr:uncharacterized protein BDCG_08592 [Blastomyces dermatitidis ER-3]EEQ85323.2 hypothetical protein BDCG_08592 [Blastomyces dermatitidis ER-3]
MSLAENRTSISSELTSHIKRRKGVQQWTEVSPQGGFQESTELSPLLLSLVHQEQAPGEPLHWSLFVAREGQTTWDSPVDITTLTSFFNLYNIAIVTELQAGIVKQVAGQKSPPQAPSWQAVTENCQGWAVCVIAKLIIKRGIIENFEA